MSTMSNDHDNEFDNIKLTNLYSVTVYRIPITDKGLSKEKYVDDSIGEGSIPSFNQTLENCINVTVDIDVLNLTKKDKIQFIDTTIIKHSNSDGYLL